MIMTDYSFQMHFNLWSMFLNRKDQAVIVSDAMGRTMDSIAGSTMVSTTVALKGQVP